MNDLETYYDNRVSSLGRDQYLSQVGHTVNGEPIPEEQFEALVSQIERSLALAKGDCLLDVCCGNGLFTRRLAASVRAAVGVDFSGALIEVARADQSVSNVQYHQIDVRRLAELQSLEAGTFDKVMMYAALQHFTTAEFEKILRQLVILAKDDCVFLIGFVPDKALKWKFYDTAERRAVHERHQREGTDIFGEWWSRSSLEHIGEQLGLKCTFEDLPDGVHASVYRFHAVLQRESTAPSAT